MKKTRIALIAAACTAGALLIAAGLFIHETRYRPDQWFYDVDCIEFMEGSAGPAMLVSPTGKARIVPWCE